MRKKTTKKSPATIKPVTQFAINGHFFQEIMQLPKQVNIVELRFELGFAIKRHSMPIDPTMAGYGVTGLRRTEPSIEVDGLLKGTRDNMKKCAKAICEEYGQRLECMRVKRLKVTVNNKEGTFNRTTKLLPVGDEGKIQRRRVLGLDKWEGGPAGEKLIAKGCSASEYSCKYSTQVVRTVVCDEIQ